MSGLQHFHHVGETWTADTMRTHLLDVHHLAIRCPSMGARWPTPTALEDLTGQHNDDHCYFGYALDPPHDWDEPSGEVCDSCLINQCGGCDEGGCGCTHGIRWPAESPWAALWAFAPAGPNLFASTVTADGETLVIRPAGATLGVRGVS